MSGKHIPGWLTALLSLVIAAPLSAAPAPNFSKSFKCPVCGNDFTQQFEGTGTSFGTRLDFKPLGPTPAPWAIPDCPKCGFVFFQGNLDKDTLKKVKAFVVSAPFKAKKDYPSYYRLALIREAVGDNPLNVGDAYIQSSWQLEADPVKNKEALEHAYQAFSFGLKSVPPDDPRYANTSLICGELERRLGRFDAAAARFQQLKSDPSLQKNPNAKKIIARQLALIAKSDSAPHAIEENIESLVKPNTP